MIRQGHVRSIDLSNALEMHYISLQSLLHDFHLFVYFLSSDKSSLTFHPFVVGKMSTSITGDKCARNGEEWRPPPAVSCGWYRKLR